MDAQTTINAIAVLSGVINNDGATPEVKKEANEVISVLIKRLK